MSQTHRMHLTVCVLTLALPACRSLKEKRGRLAPLLAALRHRFELAAAEVGAQDAWASSIVACVAVSTDAAHNQQVLQAALSWIESHNADVEVTSTSIEDR